MGPVLGPAIGIGSSLLGGWLGSRQSGMEKEAWGAAKTSMNNLTSAGQQAMGYAKDQYNLSAPAYQQAMSYYQRLLGGNRAQMSLATAAPAAQINDLYRGAQSGINRGMLRGGERDLASATLNRDRVGKLAGLVTGVQPMAAEGLSKLAGNGLDLSRGFLNSGAAAYGDAGKIAVGGMDAAEKQAARSGAAWQQAGKSLYDILAPKIPGNGPPRTPAPGFEQNDKYWNKPDYSSQNPNTWGTPSTYTPDPSEIYGGSSTPGNWPGDNGTGGYNSPYVPGTGGYGGAPPGYDPNDPNNW